MARGSSVTATRLGEMPRLAAALATNTCSSMTVSMSSLAASSSPCWVILIPTVVELTVAVEVRSAAFCPVAAARAVMSMATPEIGSAAESASVRLKVEWLDSRRRPLASASMRRSLLTRKILQGTRNSLHVCSLIAAMLASGLAFPPASSRDWSWVTVTSFVAEVSSIGIASLMALMSSRTETPSVASASKVVPMETLKPRGNAGGGGEGGGGEGGGGEGGGGEGGGDGGGVM